MARKLIILTILAFCLSGCGKFLDRFSRLPGGFTDVSIQPDKSGQRAGVIGFQSPLEMLVDVLNGGVIVYAVNTETGKVYSASGGTETSGISLVLPNGPYSFVSAGWEEANLATTPSSTARVRCGFGGAKVLSGGSEVVNINLSNLDECHDNGSDYFLPALAKVASPDKTMLPLKLVVCGKGADFSTRATTGTGSTCPGHEGSSHFYKGTINTKMERGVFFSDLDTLMFTASTNSTANPPATPYELFRTNYSTGKQTKIGVNVGTGTPPAVGASNLKRIPNHNKLAFVVDRGNTSPDEIWVYNLSNESLTKISHATVNSTAAGAKDFRVSDDGTYLVFVGDMQTDGLFELYSVPIPANDSYSPPVKISGPLVTPGIKDCASCGDEEKYFFKISPGSTNKYVVYSGVQALASRFDLHFASIDGASIPGAVIHGTGLGTIGTGAKISAGELSVANDVADHVGFSFDGSKLLYHVHVNAGPVEKIYLLNITYVQGSSLVVPAPTLILAADAKFPYFKMGKTLNRAVYTSNPGGATHTIHTLNLAVPAQNFPLFDVPASPGFVAQLELIDGDTKVVAAISNNTNVIEVRSSSTLAVANWNGGSVGVGTSVSYTGGVLVGGKKVAPLSPGGGNGGRTFLVTSDSSKILLNTDMVTLSISKLYYFTVGNTTPTEISSTDISTPGESVTSFALSANNTPFFTAAIDVVSKPELYETQLTATPPVVRRNTGSGLDQIISVGHGINDGDSNVPDFMILEANPLGAVTVKEAWAYNPANLGYMRLSKISGDTYGAGRMMVRMLKSTDGVNKQTAHSSECLKLNSPQFFGDQISTNVRIPLGNGTSTSPFAVAVDVFPLATSCTGAAETHTFPNGLGTATSCAAGSGACILGADPNLVLFLKDM